MKKALHAVTTEPAPIEAEDRGKRLAELIQARQALKDGESERRKEFKDVLATFDLDIQRLAGDLMSGQLPLFSQPASDDDDDE